MFHEGEEKSIPFLVLTCTGETSKDFYPHCRQSRIRKLNGFLICVQRSTVFGQLVQSEHRDCPLGESLTLFASSARD